MEPAKAPSSTTAVVLGLLALLVCGPIAGIPAIIYGNRTMREIHESGGMLGGGGAGRFGQIAGWVSVAYFVLVPVIAIVVVTTSGST
ncbi:MAG: hypothetical protein R2726_05865 [Acidimicrobiales bacterium]